MKRILGFLVVLAFSAGAAAQAYKWVDKDGKVRYGDTPPPGVKATPLRTPSGPTPPPPVPSADAAKKDGAAKKDEKPLTPEAAFRTRQQERAEADQKAEKERAEADKKRQNCDSAQLNLRTLQSGQRVTVTDASGERAYMDDTQRQQAIQRAQASVNEWCR
jgi:histone deacetylase complex regulatory component SIN3